MSVCEQCTVPIRHRISTHEASAWSCQTYVTDIAMCGVAGALTTLMEAAGRQGVGVFGSGPMQEAALLQQPALQVSPLLHLHLLLCMEAFLCENTMTGPHAIASCFGYLAALSSVGGCNQQHS